MESLRQIGAGFLLATLSLVLVLGSYMLSAVEGGASAVAPTLFPTSIQVTQTAFATLPAYTELVPATLPATETESVTQTPTQEITIIPPPTSSYCQTPGGWVAIIVQSYDTLNALAQTYRTTETAIFDGNCLASDQLVAGSYLYVPPRPTATAVAVCVPISGWARYVVVSGDTLTSIALRYNTTAAALQIANCMGSSTKILAGQIIRVPNVTPNTQVVPPTWTATQIIIPPTATNTFIAPTITETPVSPTSVPPSDTPEPTLPAPTLTPEPPTLTPVPEPASPTPGGVNLFPA